MRTTHCEICGMLRIYTDRGYISGCDHYPADVSEAKLSRRERCIVASVRRHVEETNILLEATD